MKFKVRVYREQVYEVEGAEDGNQAIEAVLKGNWRGKEKIRVFEWDSETTRVTVEGEKP